MKMRCDNPTCGYGVDVPELPSEPVTCERCHEGAMVPTEEQHKEEGQ